MSYRLLYNDSVTKNLTHGTKNLEPLTTKGDLYTYSTTNIRLPVGTNGKLLRCNSAATTGLDYVGDIDPGTTNSILGQSAGPSITGVDNTGFGNQVLLFQTGGNRNTAIGTSALRTIVGNSDSTAIGFNTLTASTGGQNTAIGSTALAATIAGINNVGIGYQAGTALNNAGASQNVAVGALSLKASTSSNSNTAIGYNTLISSTIGSNNIAIGANAGSSLTTGTNNINIGHVGVGGDSGVIRIGTAGTHGSAFITGIRGVTTGVVDAIPVLIDSAHQLGTISSSIRYKKNVEDMKISEKIYELRPVEFDYKENDHHSYGLIAEEVNEVMPEIVVKNSEGECETIQYQHLVPMLLNELIKQDAHIMKLEEKIVELTQMAQKLISLAEVAIPSQSI